MKKFAKMLALGLALSMTFGMAVSAAESPKKDPVVTGGVIEVTPSAEEKEEVAAAVEKVVANPSSILPGSWLTVANVIKTYYLELPEGKESAEVVFSGLAALNDPNKNYALLHVNDKGEVDDYINLGKPNAEGKCIVTLTKFSPYTLVVTSYNPPTYTGDNGTAQTTPSTNNGAPVSPKTGETLPVAGMMAVLCLAGAVLCAKKARCNN
ncbi:MAG: hypothetical protein HFH93_02725 [Lachnospiraceae bacterium]|nr:hypothetical protein [Lachnospiraceae bacterium]